MSKNWNRWIVFYLLAFSFFAAGSAYAGADELAKDVDKIIRNAERKMFGGKNDEADALLREAAVMLDQARAQDPANKLILRAEKNYERIRKNVDRKLGQSAGQTSSQVSAAPAAVSVPSGGTDLPGGVRKRLKDISRHLDRAERYASSDAKQTRYQLDQAEELFREVDKMYSGQYDPEQPDYAAARGRYDKLSRAAAERGSAEARASTDAADAEANKEKQSREWVARFRQYLSYPGQEGHDRGTLVFVPGTSEVEKFADPKRRYEAFKTF